MPGPYSVASASGEASGGYGPNGLLVELLVDGAWVDITPRVMVRDSQGQISITRGQTAEGQQPSPGSCSFQLNNRDGRFSPANPLSPLYGKIGRNTQVRVSVAKGDDKSYRFWGEISAWPEDWDTTDTDVWVDIEAAGILKRLGQGTTPLHSTMYRGLTSMATTPPVAYWPCEDGATSTSLASLSGGTPMRIIGSPTLAADTSFLCSEALPVLNGGSLTGQVPVYSVTGKSQIRFLMRLSTEPADLTQLVKIGASGTVPFWTVSYGSGGSLYVRGYDTDGLTLLCTSGPLGFVADGVPLLNNPARISLELTQVAGNIAWTLGLVQASNGFNWQYNSTFTSQTVGRIKSVTIAPGQTLTDAAFGHISVQSDVTSAFDLVGQVTAFVGESVNGRFVRLCNEQGVNVATFFPPSTDAMGPQLPGTFLGLLQEAVDVDGGVLFERETAFGLGLRSRASMYNQPPQLAVSYTGHQLSDVPRPVPDDQNTRNRITASRPTGSSATAELDSGPLSLQDPPAGVGLYPDSVTLNVQSDALLQQHAAWRLHMGTVDEPRYPAISINLASQWMTGLRLAALNVLFGRRIVIKSPPSRLGGDISQIVIGIQETITHFEHRITVVCQPESPYEVVALNSATTGRLDSASAALAGDLTPTQTSAQIATTGALWTVTDEPFDVLINGEQITISAITGTSSPQTATLTRAVNGISKAHQAGEAIHLAAAVALAL